MGSNTAIIYARWSSKEQSQGSTLARQLDACEAFARQRNLAVVDRVIDEGVSAYTGANIRDGNLASLIEDFRAGDRDPSSTIVVIEKLDRLSRADAPTMMGWLTSVMSMGIRFAIADSGRMIDHETMTNEMGSFLLLMIEAFGNHAESAKKSERISAYWEQARARGEFNPNLRHPAWLHVQHGVLVPKPGAEVLIQRIFAMALAGLGATRIAKHLNQEGILPFVSTKNAAEYWTPTRIKRILYDDAVLGYYTPHRRPRGGDAKRAGEQHKRYPAVIDQQTWDAVQAGRTHRKGVCKSISNLLPYVLRCDSCGGSMAARGSSSKGHYYLYCVKNKSGGDCDHSQGWRYFNVEKAVLDLLLSRALDDRFFARKADATAPLASQVSLLRQRVRAKTEHYQWLLSEQKVFQDLGEEIALVHRKAGEELIALKAELSVAEDSLALARGRATPSEHRQRVDSLRAAMASEDPEKKLQARQTVKAALGELIDRILFDPDRENVIVHLVGGIGTYLIAHGDVHLIEHHKGVDFSTHPRRKIIERFIAGACG